MELANLPVRADQEIDLLGRLIFSGGGVSTPPRDLTQSCEKISSSLEISGTAMAGLPRPRRILLGHGSARN